MLIVCTFTNTIIFVRGLFLHNMGCEIMRENQCWYWLWSVVTMGLAVGNYWPSAWVAAGTIARVKSVVRVGVPSQNWSKRVTRIGEAVTILAFDTIKLCYHNTCGCNDIKNQVRFVRDIPLWFHGRINYDSLDVHILSISRHMYAHNLTCPTLVHDTLL